ncbi:hypothetical protein KP509_07G051300 [Ceratopteris richardii]|uniref:glutathione transferase n=2 Tax=Ceratopteris richardii TaxID=49495 RepID=A0A8T2UGY6_CERRI|nr:hypothetical protein KP509_07G051300 [Ceratopteris richardii]
MLYPFLSSTQARQSRIDLLSSMMAPLKIYGLAMSTCTGRVLATALEKGATFELQPVDPFSGGCKKPEYLALQPFGQIPVLQDEGLTMFESRAIARYIASKYEAQGTPLYGRSLQERAKVEQWLEVESQNYNPPIAAAVCELVVKPMKGAPTYMQIVNESLAKLEKVLDIYEDHLSKNEYLAGNFFSLADLSHIPFTHYLVNVAKKGEAITSRKHVNAWWLKISSRPSWQKVLELASKK